MQSFLHIQSKFESIWPISQKRLNQKWKTKTYYAFLTQSTEIQIFDDNRFYSLLRCLLDILHAFIILKNNSVSGGGSRCCYNYQGNLMYTNDTRYGSTSDRYHIFGIPPYNVYGRVPAMSHYLNDMVPYYLCCEWTDLCDSYLFVRETAECKGYRYPKTGN